MGILLRDAAASLLASLPALLVLPSFATSLAATSRSAATDTGPQHQLQQRIISLVINGDALGNCYRAAHSLRGFFPLVSLAYPPCLTLIEHVRYLLLAHIPDRFFSPPSSLFFISLLSCSSLDVLSVCLASLPFCLPVLPPFAASLRYETAFQASLNLAPRLPKVRETQT